MKYILRYRVQYNFTIVKYLIITKKILQDKLFCEENETKTSISNLVSYFMIGYDNILMNNN